jgi:pilus assembly protein CpaE
MNVSVGLTGRSRILVCSSDAEALRTMETVFSSLASYDMVTETLASLMAKKAIDTDSFDIAIVDVGNGQILDDQRFVELRSKFGKAPLVFVSDELRTERMRQLIRLDGTDWMPKPLQSRMLIDIVNSITQRLKANANRVYAVVPCGGGAGATSVAIMLTHYLSRARKRAKPSAAVFDLDFSRAAVASYLNAGGSFDLSDVIGRPERIDLEFIDIIKKKHDSGFSVFSFESPALMTEQRGKEIVLRMLDIVAFQHDHTVVDLPSADTSWKDEVIAAVNATIVVTTNSVPGLQHAKAVVKRIADARGVATGCTVLINKVRGNFFNPGVRVKDMAKIFGDTPVIALPDEYSVMTEALNRGVLPSEVNSRSGFCKRIQALTEQVRVVV